MLVSGNICTRLVIQYASLRFLPGAWALGASQVFRCAQSRPLSLSIHNLRTKTAIRMRKPDTNLQKRKHKKYSDEFIRKEADKYKISKRRLANMMGEDPDSYTEMDVAKSIRYLFPSDLDEDSLPTLEHPSKVYTDRLKIHWDESGRPKHYLYYTMMPNAFELLHQTYQKILDVRKIEDSGKSMSRPIDLSGTRWMTKEELEREILSGEIVSPMTVSILCCNRTMLPLFAASLLYMSLNDHFISKFRQIMAQLERLLEEKNACEVEDFIMKHRKQIPVISMLDDVKEAETMEDGRTFVVEEGKKKTAIASVKLISPGTGEITINGRPYLKYFTFLDDRQTVLSPFSFLSMIGKFDTEVTVEGAVECGPMWHGNQNHRNPYIRAAAQAHAARHAIARALRTFVTEEQVEMLRRAGLLTTDKRWKERKLPGQHKARKKHTWKKR